MRSHVLFCRMRAKFVLLNHFSQRYPKIPVLNPDAPAQGHTGFAFDLMSVAFASMPELPPLQPLLAELFREEDS